MNFNIIDKNNWHRINSYTQFTEITPCTYSMTVNLDITALYAIIQKKNLKFFPTILFGISYIVNTNKEFRMDINSNGDVGYYDITNPCYAIFHEETEAFTNVWTQYNHDYSIFLDNYFEDMRKYRENYKQSKPIENPNIFNVSSIPWVSFTGFNLNLQKGYKYFPPIFTIGKFYKDNDKYILPLAIQVNHAICDGFHIAKFTNELQIWADNFNKVLLK